MTQETLYCSFCGISHHKAREMVRGEDAAICDECIRKCVGVVLAARGKFVFWLGAEAEGV